MQTVIRNLTVSTVRCDGVEACYKPLETGRCLPCTWGLYPNGLVKFIRIAFYKFIGKNYNMPNVKGLAGKVYTMFVIEIDGSIGDIKIMRDLGHGTGEEAIRVLKLCPQWKPGEFNGQKVRSSFALPISLQGN